MSFLSRLKSIVWIYSKSFQDRINNSEQSLSKQLSSIEELTADLNLFNERINNIEQSLSKLAILTEEKKQRSWQQEEQILQRFEWANDDREAKYQKLMKIGQSTLFTLNFQFERMKDKEVNTNIYNSYYYAINRYGSFISGLHVLKKLFGLLNVESVVDFGCGTGTWLYAAKILGVKEVLGLDGNYIDQSLLLIAQNEFIPHDLEKKIVLKKHYDMAMSMEVAEHLHSEAADVFVQELCNATDIVLFSAAHPGQQGDGHLNEQPYEYWQEKFAKHGYKNIEIRTFFENDWEIEEWYRANMALYVKKESYSKIKNLLNP